MTVFLFLLFLTNHLPVTFSLFSSCSVDQTAYFGTNWSDPSSPRHYIKCVEIQSMKRMNRLMCLFVNLPVHRNREILKFSVGSAVRFVIGFAFMTSNLMYPLISFLSLSDVDKPRKEQILCPVSWSTIFLFIMAMTQQEFKCLIGRSIDQSQCQPLICCTDQSQWCPERCMQYHQAASSINHNHGS